MFVVALKKVKIWVVIGENKSGKDAIRKSENLVEYTDDDYEQYYDSNPGNLLKILIKLISMCFNYKNVVICILNYMIDLPMV